jgi:hypothetical protein
MNLPGIEVWFEMKFIRLEIYFQPPTIFPSSSILPVETVEKQTLKSVVTAESFSVIMFQVELTILLKVVQLLLQFFFFNQN